MAILLFTITFLCLSGNVFPTSIVVPDCEPPDTPLWGGYGPKQDFYAAGDMIHYYCDTDTYIGGNYLRICEDTGDWTGEAPVCDNPQKFSSVIQSSTESREEENDASRASDGIRSTCSRTRRESGGAKWTAMLQDPGEVIRVMVFAPAAEVAYEVNMLRQDGSKLSCGRRQERVERLTWTFHNCPGPNNRDGVGIEIKSLNANPLELCEVVVHALTPPTCTDPKVRIQKGYLQLTRKKATLVCDDGYIRSPDKSLECIRTGVWNRKNLFCIDRSWDRK